MEYDRPPLPHDAVIRVSSSIRSGTRRGNFPFRDIFLRLRRVGAVREIETFGVASESQDDHKNVIDCLWRVSLHGGGWLNHLEIARHEVRLLILRQRCYRTLHVSEENVVKKHIKSCE